MTQKGDRHRVGISGSYGGLNLGDEAILQGIVTELRKSRPVEITVFSRNPEDTLERHAVDRALPVRLMSRQEVRPEIEALDLVVLGGGGILFDAEVPVFLREVELAQELGVPVMVYAVGAGPLKDPQACRMVCEALEKAAAVTVRDRGAYRILEEIGVHREMRITADPALLLEPEPLPQGILEREDLVGSRHLIGMSVREPGKAAPDLDEHRYHALLSNAADFMVDRFDADIVLVPMERQVRDVQHSHAVVAGMLRVSRARVLKGRYTAGQLLSLIGEFEFGLGMRLHFLIFCALAGVPFIALPYAAKVYGLLEELDLEYPPLELVNEGRLIAHIDHCWDRREDLKMKIASRLPELRRRALENNDILVRLLTGETPESSTPIAKR